MMNLILVKREGLRRQAGRGVVYPVRRGQSEAGGGSGGQRGCLTFRGHRNRAQHSLGHRPGRNRLPQCPASFIKHFKTLGRVLILSDSQFLYLLT